MRKKIVYLIALTLVMCGLTLVDSSPALAGKPRVAIGIAQPNINAGQRPVIAYSSSRTVKGSKFYLQRKMGSRGVWGNVARVRAKSGRVAAPAVSIGAYQYRVAAIAKRKHHKKIIVTSSARTVRAYGKVSLLTMCISQAWTYRCSQSGHNGVFPVGARSFAYQFDLPALTDPDFADWSFPGNTARSSCRFMAFNFAEEFQGYHGEGGRSTVRLVQQTRDAVQSSAAPGQLGTFAAALDGRPAVLQLQLSPDHHVGGHNVALAGYGLCYTASGSV